MLTNYTNKNGKLIYPELSYLLTGVCFDIHNQLGRFCREKQYADLMEKRLTELKILFKREYRHTSSGNVLDFLVDDKIVL